MRHASGSHGRCQAPDNGEDEHVRRLSAALLKATLVAFGHGAVAFGHDRYLAPVVSRGAR
jgi:hypothetical protein